MKRAHPSTGMVCCRNLTTVFRGVRWGLGSMVFLLWASALLLLDLLSRTVSSPILMGPAGIIRIIARSMLMDSSER